MNKATCGQVTDLLGLSAPTHGSLGRGIFLDQQRSWWQFARIYSRTEEKWIAATRQTVDNAHRSARCEFNVGTPGTIPAKKPIKLSATVLWATESIFLFPPFLTLRNSPTGYLPIFPGSSLLYRPRQYRKSCQRLSTSSTTSVRGHPTCSLASPGRLSQYWPIKSLS